MDASATCWTFRLTGTNVTRARIVDVVVAVLAAADAAADDRATVATIGSVTSGNSRQWTVSI